MNFTLLIHSAPYASQATLSAYHFASALVESGHTIQSVCFLQDGVIHALSTLETIEDETNRVQLWLDLKLPLKLCSTACARRGVNNTTIHADFHLCGLGEIMADCLSVDRVVSF